MQSEVRFNLGVIRPEQQDQLINELMVQLGSTLRIEFQEHSTTLLFTNEITPHTPMSQVITLLDKWMSIN